MVESSSAETGNHLEVQLFLLLLLHFLPIS